MSEQKNLTSELLTSLKQQRDEMKVQLNLASMEAKDEYDRLSQKVDQLSDHVEPLAEVAEDTAENVFAALGLAMDEIKVGFDRIRKSISE